MMGQAAQVQGPPQFPQGAPGSHQIDAINAMAVDIAALKNEIAVSQLRFSMWNMKPKIVTMLTLIAQATRIILRT